MDYKESRSIFVGKILEAIPAEIKPIDYLMDILHLSKVSVYRRINCDVPFTYDEIFTLMPALNLSSDSIFSPNKNKKDVFFNGNSESDVCEFFHDILSASYDNIVRMCKHPDSEIIVAMNHLWLLFTFLHKNLFRFHYYKWVHTCSSSFDTAFEEIEIPGKLLAMIHKIKDLEPSYKSVSYIFDKNTFLNTMFEIQYYYRRKLITANDLALIADDLKDLIDITCKRFRREDRTSYYLSYLSIYCNCLYIGNENELRSIFGEHFLKPRETTDPDICIPHKRWLEFIKNYSMKISGSNEASQIDFIREQRIYLNDLIEDNRLAVI
ncbi:MAG: hypothetical protein LBU84_05400 [Prevotella sp.]|jgi:hypothetical protein|nr:hypothetical protein [Prevotella sp.]